MEKEITAYLKEKYTPVAIVLGGSRGEGKHHAKSDWDLYVFTTVPHENTFVFWQGQLLDVAFRLWPQKTDAVLTIPYKPLAFVRVLFDETGGALQDMLQRTAQLYEIGPLKAYPAACEGRLEKVSRWNSKILTHAGAVDVQFYYIGQLYELIIRIWFEQRNEWPLPPALALPAIKERDSDMWELLQQLSASRGETAVAVGAHLAEAAQTWKE